jgi:transposase
MQYFYEDGTGNVFDEKGDEATTFIEEKSFRLRKLTDLRKYIKNTEVHFELEEPEDIMMEETPPKKERATQYNIYTDEDRRRYFYFMSEKLMKPKEAAKAANVNYDTARKWKQIYDRDPEKNIPLKKTNRTPNRPVSQLNENHKKHLISFFDENPSAYIQDAVDDLTTSFAGLEIRKSRVAEFMKEECNLSIKTVSRHPVARNSEKTMQERAEWVQKWINDGMDYLKNCIFIDESGFDINMRRSRGWAARGSPAVITTPSARAVSHTIIGAISAFGVVNISLREPGNVKRRKVVGATKRKSPEDRISVPKGTTSGHYLNFINDTMDIMDEFPEMRGFFIVMDNAPIHVPDSIDPIIEKRGYKPVYLPPYSPELNPIEQFWAILKGKVKRSKFTNTDSLTSRIIEAIENVPAEHLHNFVQHSVNQFENCLNKLPI